MDQGNAVLNANPVVVEFIKANRGVLQGADVMPSIDGDTVTWERRRRDTMESGLSKFGFARPVWQENIVELLNLNEAAPRPLVLIPYSRASGEMSSALRRYIDDYVSRKGEGSRAEVEAHLRKYVTLFSYGNVDRKWPDGPAYVHMSSRSNREEGTDWLTGNTGVHADAPQGAGADAVFVHNDGVFSSFDTHNFGAIGSPALSLIFKMNGCNSFRELWEKGREQKLRVPDFEQCKAAVVLTDGLSWLWGPREPALKGVELPSMDEAKRVLAEWL
jgi:hypothetical protein